MKARIGACPKCGRNVVWETAKRYRPFCSERCRLIDLGAWANENYRIPVPDSKDDFESAPEAGEEPPPAAG